MTRTEPKQTNLGSTLAHLISVWSLLILLVALILAFSIIKPDTFPTYFNFRSIVNNKSVQALLALAVFLPMTANHFDLSVGFLLGISQVLVIGLQGQGLTWPEASAVVMLLGAVVGLTNGILVTIVGIDSFIATLGTGTLLYGFNEWYTGGQQVVAGLPESFINISGAVFGVPLPAIYVLVLSVSLWMAVPRHVVSWDLRQKYFVGKVGQCLAQSRDVSHSFEDRRESALASEALNSGAIRYVQESNPA